MGEPSAGFGARLVAKHGALHPSGTTHPIDRYGTPGGPLAIAIHGAVANRKTWLPLSRVLRADLELWCADLPGHGSRANEPFALDSALAAIDDLIAAAAPRRAIVAGDSLGGYLALLAAARDDRGRIAAACVGGCTWTMTGMAGVLARASDLPVRAFERLAGTARLERAGLRILATLTDAETARAVAAVGLRLRSRSESLAALADFDLAATAREIRVPIAIVNGARDWPTRAGEGTLLKSACRASLTIAPNAGHGVGLFAPSVFARAIESLVSRE